MGKTPHHTLTTLCTIPVPSRTTVNGIVQIVRFGTTEDDGVHISRKIFQVLKEDNPPEIFHFHTVQPSHMEKHVDSKVSERVVVFG